MLHLATGMASEPRQSVMWMHGNKFISVQTMTQVHVSLLSPPRIEQQVRLCEMHGLLGYGRHGAVVVLEPLVQLLVMDHGSVVARTQPVRHSQTGAGKQSVSGRPPDPIPADR